DAFAAELRASAGLTAASPATARRRLSLAPARALATRAAAHPRVRRTGRLLGELAPIWWAARAYVVVAIAASLAGAACNPLHPTLPHIGGGWETLAVLALALVLSVALGRRERRLAPSWRPFLLAANILLAIAAIPVVEHLASQTPTRVERITYPVYLPASPSA